MAAPAQRAWVRWVLGVVLAFSAVNAFGGGVYGMAGAEGVPLEWLEGSPFADDLIPSLILFFVVGGAFALAAVAVLRRWPRARRAAAAAGVVALGWIAVQVAILGFVSWLQPATAVTAIAILALASRLPDGPRE